MLNPHVLVKPNPELVELLPDERVRITTTEPKENVWRHVNPLTGELPQAWLTLVLPAEAIAPFAILPHRAQQYVLPRSSDGTRLATSEHASSERFWNRLDEVYRSVKKSALLKHLGKTRQIDEFISWELEQRTVVATNITGKDLRAAITRGGPAPPTTGQFLVGGEEEALYLVGVLNAPCTGDSDTLRKLAHPTRTKTFWKELHVPPYDHSNELHRDIGAHAKDLIDQADLIVTQSDSNIDWKTVAELLHQGDDSGRWSALDGTVAALLGRNTQPSTVPRQSKQTTPSPPTRRRSQVTPMMRSEIWERQEGRCNGCLKPTSLYQLTIDHVVPKSQGGGGEENNLQLLCGTCNSKKGGRSQKEFIARLRSEGIRDE